MTERIAAMLLRLIPVVVSVGSATIYYHQLQASGRLIWCLLFHVAVIVAAFGAARAFALCITPQEDQECSHS